MRESARPRVAFQTIRAATFTAASILAIGDCGRCIHFAAAQPPRAPAKIPKSEARSNVSHQKARWAELRGKARKVLDDTLAAFLTERPPVKVEKRIQWLRILSTWPFPLIEKRVAGFLDDSAAEVKLVACESLVQHAADKYRVRILAALKGFHSDDKQQEVRVAVIRLRLGEKQALKEVRDWATLEPYLQKLKEGAHWCPMHPRILKRKKGKCPICEMSLIRLKREFDFFSSLTELSLLALEPLAERKDPVVQNAARHILVSNAQAGERIRALVFWARVAPSDARPHLRLFLTTTSRERAYAIRYTAHFVPEQFLPELEKIAADQREAPATRQWAAVGLVKAGRRKQLELIRRFVALQPTEKNGFVRAEAIAALANFGTKDDVERIARHLNGEFKGLAAASLLRLLNRVSR